MTLAMAAGYSGERAALSTFSSRPPLTSGGEERAAQRGGLFAVCLNIHSAPADGRGVNHGDYAP